jgi:hypothetical protein
VVTIETIVVAIETIVVAIETIVVTIVFHRQDKKDFKR